MSKPTLNLDSETKLNTEIMNVYDSIKAIGHSDYGFANCDYSFPYGNLDKLNKDFVKHVNAFLKNKQYNSQKFKDIKDIKDVLNENMREIREDGDNNYFQYFLYDIASVLRDFDGHGLDEKNSITGEYEEPGEDYPVIQVLKDPGTVFLKEVLDILPNKSVDVTFETTYSSMGVSAGLYFSIIYDLLLKTVLEKVRPGGGTTRRRSINRRGTRRRRRM